MNPYIRVSRHIFSCAFALICSITGSNAISANPVADSLPKPHPIYIYPEQIQRQKLIDRQKVFTIGNTDTTTNSDESLRTLMDIFYTDQFRTVNDPEAPYFMLMTKDTRLAMGIGGVINLRGWEDWNGVVEPYIFMPYYIPIPKNPAKMQRLYATPANSGIFFTLLGRNTVVGDFSAYIEGMFNGYNRINFKVRRAYLTLKGFTVGYTYSTFMDAQALPRLVDAGLYGGVVDRAAMIVSYQHKLKKGWSVAGGLEFPSSYIADSEPDVEACMPYLPDVAAYGQYQWNEGYSHVRLSGIIRTLSYRDLLHNKNHNKLGWGLALSTMLKIIPPLTFYGTTTYGAGHSGYLSDLSNGMHDLVGIKGQPGVLVAPKSFSYFVALKYNYLPELYSTVAFTQSRTYESNPVDIEGFKYGYTGSVNLFWEITPRLSTGIEYMIGKRMNFSREHGYSDRAEVSLRLSF